MGETLTATEYLSLYQLKRDQGHEGWYYASPWKGANLITIDRNPGAAKLWKKKWFFATQHWEFPPGESPTFRVPNYFRVLGHFSDTFHMKYALFSFLFYFF